MLCIGDCATATGSASLQQSRAWSYTFFTCLLRAAVMHLRDLSAFASITWPAQLILAPPPRDEPVEISASSESQSPRSPSLHSSQPPSPPPSLSHNLPQLHRGATTLAQPQSLTRPWDFLRTTSLVTLPATETGRWSTYLSPRGRTYTRTLSSARPTTIVFATTGTFSAFLSRCDHHSQ